MIDPLQASFKIASSGLQAQSNRLRVISENVANAESTGNTPGADPYAQKTITFESELDRASGASLMRTKSIGVDNSPFRLERNPGHPAADENGYVKLPNVDPLIEMADMREANRSYQANLQTYKQSRELFSMTIDLLEEWGVIVAVGTPFCEFGTGLRQRCDAECLGRRRCRQTGDGRAGWRFRLRSIADAAFGEAVQDLKSAEHVSVAAIGNKTPLSKRLNHSPPSGRCRRRSPCATSL